MDLSKQGKGTADHLLPFGDWLGFGPKGGQSPAEHRGNLYACTFLPVLGLPTAAGLPEGWVKAFLGLSLM